MMSNKISCEVIKDLLPLYVEGLTSEVSNQAIEEHIATCNDCREALSAMKQPVESEEELLDRQEEHQEIDFLKKTRRKNKKIVIGSIICAVVVIGAVIFARPYFVSEAVDPYMIASNTKVEGNHVTLQGVLLETGQGVSKIDLTVEDGIVTYQFESNQSPRNTGEFDLNMDINDTVAQIRIGERILWDQGVEIDALTSKVYQTKHPYVGDMSANGATANALMMFMDFDYTNELQTSQEPYGWTFCLTDMPAMSEDVAETMKADAYVLMAVIGNLEQVTYKHPDGSVVASFSAEEASKELGQNLKTYGETPASLQELIELLGLA